MPEVILRVAVPAPLPQLFDYLPPRGAPTLTPGQRLRVPFGRGTRVGVLIALATTAQVARERLKRATEVLDESPCVDRDWLALCQWIADYYHHPLGEVIATFLPVLLRQGKPARTAPPQRWALTEAGQALNLDSLRRAPRQQALLSLLKRNCGALDAAELREALGGGVSAVLSSAAKKGWIARVAADSAPVSAAEPGPRLNPDQQRATDEIGKSVGFQAFLLEGITGSGKTEVYLRSIAERVARGQQALVLAPEIGLTPQLIARFRQRLGVPLVVLHSGLSETERLAAWLQAQSGAARVVIGTRSAVLTPLPQLGLIIVDEEHDLSYKQQEGLRYSARDLAVRRAQQAGIPVVLGSATPSLESLHNAQSGRYTTLHLTARTGDARPPRVATLDLRGQALLEGLAPKLITAIRQHLDARGQVLLFLNRRGYAPTWLCHSCGWIADCPRCDARMTFHRTANRLRCHHCGHEQRPVVRCPDCDSAELIPLGEGTERVEQALRHAFPRAQIARVDRDSTRRKGAMDKLLDDARAGRTDILIGTQMLAKGHDFPEVTLAAVINADGGLFSADFRAPERLGQLIVQVAGRAGRAARPGEVLIQTHHPEHPLFAALLRDGYPAFARGLLDERAQTGLPPTGYLALLRAEAPQREAPQHFLTRALEAASGAAEVQLWGPVTAPRERVAGRYRAQLLLQSTQRNALHALLRRWMPTLAGLPEARRVRWSLDVDPQDLS